MPPRPSEHVRSQDWMEATGSFHQASVLAFWLTARAEHRALPCVRVAATVRYGGGIDTDLDGVGVIRCAELALSRLRGCSTARTRKLGRGQHLDQFSSQFEFLHISFDVS